MLTYRFDDKHVRIKESMNGADIEFHIEVLDELVYVPKLKAIRTFFEENSILTDVLFYAYPHHVYTVIVQQAYYTDFILQLLKHRVLEAVEWSE